ncbi:ATP-binding protein [Clostridiaceae bacterium 35-E11]
MIDINKLDSGYLKLELKNYNIVQVIGNITLSVVKYIKSNNINIIFDTQVEEKMMACDVDKIERVMLNLLSNAVKFTKDNGEIRVNIDSKDEHVIISVKDTGIGIPEDMRDKIFERFKQVDVPLSKRAEGSGIGLSLVKSIIQLHGGDIRVKSEYGKGSEFIIALPVKMAQEEALNQDETAVSSEKNVERIHIEFSDIYA